MCAPHQCTLLLSVARLNGLRSWNPIVSRAVSPGFEKVGKDCRVLGIVDKGIRGACYYYIGSAYQACRKAKCGEIHAEMGRKRDRRRRRRDVQSPHLIFKLGRDCIRVSAIPKTATQTPTSVRRASVERPCDWLDSPAVGSRRAACGNTAAWVEDIKCALNNIRVK